MAEDMAPKLRGQPVQLWLEGDVIMAETLISLLEQPDLLEKAKEEFRKRVGKGYIPPIPEGVRPRTLTEL